MDHKGSRKENQGERRDIANRPLSFKQNC
jgi:hypothetical protein